MTTQTTPKQAEPGAPERRPTTRPMPRLTTGSKAMRTRRASEVFRILEPSPMQPISSVPIGLWKTGWLPKPLGAVS